MIFEGKIELVNVKKDQLEMTRRTLEKEE